MNSDLLRRNWEWSTVASAAVLLIILFALGWSLVSGWQQSMTLDVLRIELESTKRMAARLEERLAVIESTGADSSVENLEQKLSAQNSKMLQLYDQIDKSMYEVNRKVQRLEQGEPM